MSRLPRAIGVLGPKWRAQVGDYARCLVWDAAGRQLLVGDAAGTLTCLDAAAGAVQWETRAHDGGVLALAAHPSRALLASAGADGRGCLWALDGDGTPTPLAEFPGDAAWVEHLAWSPAGTSLASASGRVLRMWGADGTPLARCDAHASAVSGLAWCSEAEIATACYGRVTFWETTTGRPRETLDWKGSLISLVVSPDGAIVACGSQDRTVHFWRRHSGEDSMMSGYPAKPAVLAFDRRSRLLATSGADYVTVWSFAGAGPEGTKPGLLEAHEGQVSALAFAAARPWLAAGDRAGLILLWDLDDSGEGRPIGAASATGAVETLTWHPSDTALAIADAAGGVSLWSVAKHCEQL
jgi:YD repeat-containing protein